MQPQQVCLVNSHTTCWLDLRCCLRTQKGVVCSTSPVVKLSPSIRLLRKHCHCFFFLGQCHSFPRICARTVWVKMCCCSCLETLTADQTYMLVTSCCSQITRKQRNKETDPPTTCMWHNSEVTNDHTGTTNINNKRQTTHDLCC